MFCKSLFALGICRSMAFPCQCAWWQRPRFLFSKQRPFFHILTWISSQLLQERSHHPLKAMLELPLPLCIGPRYILTHPRGCFQGDDSEPSPPRTEGRGQARFLALCHGAWQCPGPAPATSPAPQGIPRWGKQPGAGVCLGAALHWGGLHGGAREGLSDGSVVGDSRSPILACALT